MSPVAVVLGSGCAARGCRGAGAAGSTRCNEAADDGFTSSITLCGTYVYVVATSIKRGQISCVCAAAKLAVVTFPSASLLYNLLLPLKLRAREKPPPCQLLVLAALLIPSPQHRAQHPPSSPGLKPRVLSHGLGCSAARGDQAACANAKVFQPNGFSSVAVSGEL